MAVLEDPNAARDKYAGMKRVISFQSHARSLFEKVIPAQY